MKNLTVEDAKLLLNSHQANGVVMFVFGNNDTTVSGASYGETKSRCKVYRRILDDLMDSIQEPSMKPRKIKRKLVRTREERDKLQLMVDIDREYVEALHGQFGFKIQVHDFIMQVIRERDAYKRDWEGELAGNNALRDHFGARKSESFVQFIERLTQERDEALRKKPDELIMRVKDWSTRWATKVQKQGWNRIFDAILVDWLEELDVILDGGIRVKQAEQDRDDSASSATNHCRVAKEAIADLQGAQHNLELIRMNLQAADYEGESGYKDLLEPGGIVDGVRWMIMKRNLLRNHAEANAAFADEEKAGREKAEVECKRMVKALARAEKKLGEVNGDLGEAERILDEIVVAIPGRPLTTSELPQAVRDLVTSHREYAEVLDAINTWALHLVVGLTDPSKDDDYSDGMRRSQDDIRKILRGKRWFTPVCPACKRIRAFAEKQHYGDTLISKKVVLEILNSTTKAEHDET